MLEDPCKQTIVNTSITTNQVELQCKQTIVNTSVTTNQVELQCKQTIVNTSITTNQVELQSYWRVYLKGTFILMSTSHFVN